MNIMRGEREGKTKERKRKREYSMNDRWEDEGLLLAVAMAEYRENRCKSWATRDPPCFSRQKRENEEMREKVKTSIRYLKQKIEI